MARKHFVVGLHFIDFYNISLGLSVCLNLPNLEIHLPFCFIRIGWVVGGSDTSIFELTTYKEIERQNHMLSANLISKQNG
jgi:hypothetical protein